MRAWHLVVVLVIGYAIGVLWPAPGSKFKSLITGATGA